MAFSAFAVTAPGLEPLAAAELRDLGVTAAEVQAGGVAFDATESVLATALLQLRTVTRVLVRIAQFRATSFAQLERRARAIAWSEWVAAGAHVRFRVTCKKSRLYHSDAVAERLATALVAGVTGVLVVTSAPETDDETDDSAQLIVVRFSHDECTVSMDAAGVALHKRGYRQAIAKAPLRETLAAAMLLGAEWDASGAVVDPMCGAGTLVIEAALIARRIAPGAHRAFAAEMWPAASRAAWSEARASVRANVVASAPAPLVGSDRDAGAIVAARANAARAGVENDVEFAVGSVSEVRAPPGRGILITNPPYGVRVGDSAPLRDLYARFGRVAREQFAGWRCALLSADRTRGHVLERQLALPLRPAWRSSNGGIPVRLLAGDVP